MLPQELHISCSPSHQPSPQWLPCMTTLVSRCINSTTVLIPLLIPWCTARYWGWGGYLDNITFWELFSIFNVFLMECILNMFLDEIRNQISHGCFSYHYKSVYSIKFQENYILSTKHIWDKLKLTLRPPCFVVEICLVYLHFEKSSWLFSHCPPPQPFSKNHWKRLFAGTVAIYLDLF